MFEAAQVERAQRAVCADGDEDIRRIGQPRDVVHLAVVRDELRHRRRRVQIPNCTCRIDRGRDHEARHLLVPRKIGEWRAAALALYLGLL